MAASGEEDETVKSAKTTTSSLEELVGSRALLVASTGGHLAQLDKLHAGHLRVASDPTWVTFKNSQSESLLNGRHVEWLPYIPSRGWKEALACVPRMVRIIRSTRPEVVVSTGAAVAAVALPVARLMGVKVHYIESVSRFDGPSLTGRMVSFIPGIRLHTQHEKWADKRWIQDVSLLDDYQRIASNRLSRVGDSPKVFVTLGTIKPFRFDRLVDRLLAILPSNADVTWQLGETYRNDLPGRAVSSMTSDEMDRELKEADFVISHAGVGTALRAMDLGRRPVLVPRRSAHGEHVDDHQLQIARELAARGLAVSAEADQLSLAEIYASLEFALVNYTGDGLGPVMN